MTQTLQVDAPRPLTSDELERVQAFVRNLFETPSDVATQRARTFDFAAIDKLFAGRRIGGDKTSVELVHEAMAAWADEVERKS